ncbi:MAG: C25 family cysteine peptidase [Melioribacteraceae bacterium]
MSLKKYLVILLTFLIVISFSSCQKEDTPIEPDSTENKEIDNGIDFNRFKGEEMLIITVDKFVNELQPFINYKKSIGMNVVLNTFAAPVGVEAIKNAIQAKYEKDGLHFIILVGDIEDVPSPYFQGSPSDPSYALLEGDDLIGDALISRISVKSYAELKNIVNKLLIYQKGEFRSKDWITNAIVVGTYHFDGVNHTSGITSVLRNHTSYFKNVYQVLETDQNPHPDLMNAIENNGANMIVYNSHGFSDGFYSIAFKNNHLPELKTFGNSFPFIHGAACLTGSFEWSVGDCFAEAVLKTGTYEKPAGPIGMLAFSRSTDAAPAMTAQRIAFKELYFDDKIETIGELCYFSNLLAMKEFDTAHSEQFYKHWHLFGDCSMSIWKHAE